MNKCCIICPEGEYGSSEYKDENGCIKQEGHHDYHAFESSEGKIIAWEDDYDCPNECDCWDKGGNCIVLWELKTETNE